MSKNIIEQLELLKSEIEWDHSLEYQTVIDTAIIAIKTWEELYDYMRKQEHLAMQEVLKTPTNNTEIYIQNNIKLNERTMLKHKIFDLMKDKIKL